jgi:hypothetical protein
MNRTRLSSWEDSEAAILEGLARLRELAGGPAATTGSMDGSLGVVDLVRGSEGVWQAFWLHADLHATPAVGAIIPDLRPIDDLLAGVTSEEWHELRQLLGDRDLSIRLVLPSEVTGSPLTRAVADELADAGIEVRTAETSAWFFVAGDQVAVTPTTWGLADEVDVAVLRGGPMVGALAELFEIRWRAATPWMGGESVHHQVRALLAAGHSDEDVAEALGSSVRTVRRRVAEAMEAHGASTRFELGHRYASATFPS